MSATIRLLTRSAALLLVCAVVVAGCQRAAEPSRDRQPPAKTPIPEETAMKIAITSSAFKPNEPIPRKYTGEGPDVSPPLAWSDVPAGTKELALIMDDPDAPRPEPWVHWVIYKLPPTLTGLPEGVPKTPTLTDPAGALQGNNTWPKIGYKGPMPPEGHGVHHYHFKLYALDAALDVKPGLDKRQLLAQMKGHVLGEGELIGTYER